MDSLDQLLRAAGHDPLAQAIAIILGTFILEDAATVVAAMRAQSGGVPMPVALGALYVGIVLGDLGVYGLGRLAGSFAWARRWAPDGGADGEGGVRATGAWMRAHVFRVVFVSRFIPGARLPAYTACGFLRADPKRFALAAVLATSIWTTGLFALSLRIGAWLEAHLGAWRWAGVACLVAAIVVIGRMAARRRKRRA